MADVKFTVEERALVGYMGDYYLKSLQRAITNANNPIIMEANKRLREDAQAVFTKLRALGVM